jgi:hypothetical protein
LLLAKIMRYNMEEEIIVIEDDTEEEIITIE